MGIFRRRKKILDLTEKYKREQEKAAELQSNSETDSSESFGFLGDMASASRTSSDDTVDISSTIETRKRQLSKRLLQLTEKIEDLSNQIYHLQQRIEVLERKANVGSY